MVDTLQAMEATVFSSKSTEYFTPSVYVEAARTVMGGIDLDPAAHPFAQTWIKATKIYTIEDDGLNHFWRGRVWLNPPYSKGKNNLSNASVWSTRLCSFFSYGDVTQAVLLVKAALGYKWFESLFPKFPVCLTRERIRFITVDKQMPPAKQANAFFYMGPERKWPLFKSTFAKFGRVIMPD